MLARRLAPLALLLARCSVADPGERVAQPIAGGVNDATHTAVVGIAISHDGTSGVCSGTLITPTLVLTARHCVSPVAEGGVLCAPATVGGVARAATVTQAPYAASSFRVTTDASMSRATQFTVVESVIVPPDSTGALLCGRDIALLRLAAPITRAAPIAPRLDLEPTEAEGFTAVGYGSTTVTGFDSGRRRMRAGLRVEHVGSLLVRGLTLVEDREWLADEGTCHGDSGGPALDEVGQVFGVLSRGSTTDCVSQVYTRVDAWADWLRAEVTRAADEDRYDVPVWVAPFETRFGALGDVCRSNGQCESPLRCLPTGRALECTTTHCDACPEGWVCRSEGDRCVHDPALLPPLPTDAGARDAAVADASTDVVSADAPADAATADAPPAAQGDATSSGCAVAGAGASRVPAALGVWALALAFARRRRRVR